MTRRSIALACALLVLPRPSFAGPILAPAVDYLTWTQARALVVANGGSITWVSEKEAVGVTYWTPQAGPQARVGTPFHLLDTYEEVGGPRTWFVLTLANLDTLTCGGTQSDVEQHPLDRRTLTALVIDTEKDCPGGSPHTPAPVPEPGSLILLGTGLCGVVAIYRRRASRVPIA